MYDSDFFPDDVPVADAAEQQRPVSEPAVDEEEAAAGSSAEWPLEAAGPDWQEQLETVDLDPEEDTTDI
jgi:hypothetical protein